MAQSKDSLIQEIENQEQALINADNRAKHAMTTKKINRKEYRHYYASNRNSDLYENMDGYWYYWVEEVEVEDWDERAKAKGECESIMATLRSYANDASAVNSEMQECWDLLDSYDTALEQIKDELTKFDASLSHASRALSQAEGNINAALDTNFNADWQGSINGIRGNINEAHEAKEEIREEISDVRSTISTVKDAAHNRAECAREVRDKVHEIANRYPGSEY